MPRCWHSLHSSQEYPIMLCCRRWLPGYSVVREQMLWIMSLHKCLCFLGTCLNPGMRVCASSWVINLTVKWLCNFIHLCVCLCVVPDREVTHMSDLIVTSQVNRDLECAIIHPFLNPPFSLHSSSFISCPVMQLCITLCFLHCKEMSLRGRIVKEVEEDIGGVGRREDKWKFLFVFWHVHYNACVCSGFSGCLWIRYIALCV